MTTGTLPHFENAFSSIGWFLPPYAAMGFLSAMASEILRKGNEFGQGDLEQWLAHLYGADSLAAMVCSRYLITPVITEYKETIAESIEAHFLGLHHVAVAGLVPVIEGAGRELLASRGLSCNYVREVFSKLASDCKRESIEKNIGATGEIISMMDSFTNFTNNVLYVDSKKYPFIDGTNRHGITHGSFKDGDYGSPINFYKTIGAVDFLAFVSAFRAAISWFAPEATAESRRLASYYRELQGIRSKSGRSFT
ncbi:hypothetical protein [Undibacterium griseum]|uniref:Uncharacterized protein n=1 Tax=Undibacterium griseum TaxID=2762295 RepID=A0ABR6YPR2_9BURK|nr:hypothetical protein [Undibacterium griseum]MBC3885871.1 hypothetical protein [Undibacterium griseum]